MAIKLDEDNKVVVYENEPEDPRSLFPNIPTASTIEGDVGDVLLNGVSIVDENGDAEIPRMGYGNTWGVGSLGASANSGGIALDSDGAMYIAQATEAYIQGGVQRYRPITPNMQHLSAFYGLSKVAGVDLSGETITPGQYTDAAKIAIQKMLGIYEAPWEVIKEGSFTNETEANYTVNTDSNNQPFEITDARIIFRLPKQDVEASKGDYGVITLTGSIVDTTIYLGAWTQPANSTARGGYGIVEQNRNLLETWYIRNTTEGADGNLVASYRSTGTASRYFKVLNGENIFTSITFTAVKGTAEYAIYGRRKWR